ncbi:hypothetical protein ACFV5G_12940, partial [Streptomyces sp. NPDC059766]
MDEQRVSDDGPPRRWRHGPLGHLWDEEERGTRWPWRSTVAITVLVLGGSSFAAHAQQSGRLPLDVLARVLLLAGSALLLWRKRYPALVAFGTAAATLAYLAAGYAYGPVFLTVAVACFSAVLTGHRGAAWSAVGMLWAGHVLVAHWLYRWLPPAGDPGGTRGGGGGGEPTGVRGGGGVGRGDA